MRRLVPAAGIVAVVFDLAHPALIATVPAIQRGFSFLGSSLQTRLAQLTPDAVECKCLERNDVVSSR